MSPKRFWFQNVSAALAVVMAFLPVVPSTAEAAPKAENLEFKRLNLSARAQLQVTDPETWKKQEAARNAINRMVALEKLRQHTGAKAQEQKAAQAKKVALEIQRARPTAAAERALAKGKALGWGKAQRELELQKADPQLVAKLKTRKPPAVDPDSKPKLDPARMSPVQLPKPMSPRKSEHGALTPAMKSFYASVAGEGAEVLQEDGTAKTVEETLAELSIPTHAVSPGGSLRASRDSFAALRTGPLHATLTSDLGMLMAPLSALPPPTPDDLLETNETRRSPELLALVQQLGPRPLDLYNFVHTKVTPQLYYGSKKGAAQTLAELAGNDFDHASLLIALLRVAGHPARYEYGTVELSAAQAISLTGAKDLVSASVMLSRTSPSALSADGKTIQVERAWVRAFVPYELDRGSAAGTQKQWVRLDPGLKETKGGAAVSVKGLAHFDFDGFKNQPTSKTPLDVFEAQLLTAAKARSLCNNLDDAVAKVSVTQKSLALLPAEHPARVVQSLATFSRPPSTYRTLIDVTLDGEALPQFELAELEGRDLALTFPGATPADAAAISAAGGIAFVSPQLVRVRPSLLVDGQVRGAAAPVNPGTAQTFVVRVTLPAASAVVGVHHILSGKPYALMLEGGAATKQQVTARVQGMTATAGDTLDLARARAQVATYTHETERADVRLYGLQGSAAIRDVFIGLGGRPLKATYFLGLPVAVAEGDYILDVSRDSTTPLPFDGDDTLGAELLRWAGWHGSVLEHRSFEVMSGGVAMSTVKTFQVAAAQGVDVFTLTPSNPGNRTQLSGYSAATLSDIDQALGAGWTAIVPRHPISTGAFQNVEGYALENPVTGEGAYRVGELLNGDVGKLPPVAGTGANNPVAACVPTNSTCGLATGAWRIDRTDLTLPAVGMPIVFARTYSSQAAELTPLGYGWMHSYGMFLRAEAGGSFSYVMQNWQEVRFTKVGATYVTAPGWFLTLTDTASGGHAMRAKDGIVWEFDAGGALTRISEPSGNATTLVYSGGQLTQVKDSGGQVALTLTYTGSKLTSVLDRAGRLVRFGHTNDDLTAVTDVLNHTETYGYDNGHNLTSRIDKRGKAFFEFYDLQDRWLGYRDPLGGEASVAYDFVNRRSVFTDRTGASWTTEFDGDGTPTAKVDPLGNRTETTWNEDFKPLTTKDARGFTTTMTYDALGNQLSRAAPDGITQTFQYEPVFSRQRRVDQSGIDSIVSTFDAAGRVLTRTDGLGTTTFGYDSLGQLETVTAPGPATATFGRDARGNVTSVLDATGRTTAMGFDAAGHLTSTTDGNLHTRTMTVDAAGRVLEMRDALLQKTEFTYDDEGHRLTSKDPANAVTSSAYDALGRMTSSTDALGNVRRTEYDAEGRVTASIDAKGNRTAMRYDAAGRMVELTAADGAVTTQGYCADVGPACAVVDPLGHLTKTEFDSVGRVTSTTDALGRVSTTSYDFAGRTREVRGPMQVPTRFDYLTNGLLSSTTNLGINEQTLFEHDARGNRLTVWANYPSSSVTRYTYDLANRLLTEKNPLGTVTSFTYDAAGNRATKLDGNGQTTTYAYDDNRRLTSVTFSDATKYEYAYDSRGNRMLEKNANHERHLVYDARNQVETVNDVTFGKTLTYGYDPNGNRASLTEGTTTFGYFYDSQNRLKRADAFGGSLFFEYDAAGRRTSLSRPNGIRTAYSYDDANQVLGIVHAKGPQVVLGFTYGYDAHGMRTSKTRETGYREAYGYDAADRLVRVDYGTAKRVEYFLDNLGNRLREETTTSPSTGLVARTGTFNAFNQLTSSGGPGTTFPPTTNAWDLNGNLLTEMKSPSGLPPEVTTYAWDKDNRLKTITPPVGTATAYAYDANGLRTQRVDASGATRYLLDGQSVLEELDGVNATSIKYLNNPQVIDEALAYQRGSQTEYPLTDALGSLYAASDASGNVVRRYDFDVYGKRSDLGGTAPAVDVGYTGRWHDLNGLIEHRDRQRRPETGTWLQADRLKGSGRNIYQYVRSSPAAYFDPSGMAGTANFGCGRGGNTCVPSGMSFDMIKDLAKVAFISIASNPDFFTYTYFRGSAPPGAYGVPGSFFLPNLLAAGFQEADWYGLSCDTSTGWDAATYPTSEGYTIVLYPSAKGHIVKTLVHEFTHVHFNSLGFKQDFDTDSGTGPFAYQRRILITRERGDTHEMLDVVDEQNAVGRPIGQADQVGEALSRYVEEHVAAGYP